MKKLIQLWSVLLCIYSCSASETAHEIAKQRSDLRIKKSYEILEFTKDFSFTGSGIINIIFRLNENEVRELVHICRNKNYKSLTVNNLVKDGFLDTSPEYGKTLYSRDIRVMANGVGYYKLKARDINNLDFSMTVLDVTNKELIIYVSIP